MGIMLGAAANQQCRNLPRSYFSSAHSNTGSKSDSIMRGSASLQKFSRSSTRSVVCRALPSGSAASAGATKSVRQLILLRHADSEINPAVRDHDRQLSAKGKRCGGGQHACGLRGGHGMQACMVGGGWCEARMQTDFMSNSQLHSSLYFDMHGRSCHVMHL